MAGNLMILKTHEDTPKAICTSAFWVWRYFAKPFRRCWL